MLALKRVVTVAVMIYLLLALLFILVPSVRSSVAGLDSALSAVERERDFFQVLAVIGVVILGLHLVTENLDSSLLRRSVSQQDTKINELKAKLYDHQQRTSGQLGGPISPVLPPTATTDYPATTPTERPL